MRFLALSCKIDTQIFFHYLHFADVGCASCLLADINTKMTTDNVGRPDAALHVPVTEHVTALITVVVQINIHTFY